MNARHVRLLVRIELIRRWRSLTGNTRRLIAMGIAGILLLLPFGAMIYAANVAGSSVTAGEFPIPVDLLRGAAGAAVITVAVLVAIRAVQTTAVPTNADGVLTMAEHREVVLSIVILEGLLAVLLFGLPALAVGIAFGVGAGTAESALFIVLGLGLLIVLGVPIGLAVGFLIRNALARSRLLARYRTLAAITLFVAYMAVIVTGEFDSAILSLARSMGGTPLGWYGDLVLLGMPVATSLTNALAAVGLTVIGAPAATLLVDRLAATLWYRQPVQPEVDRSSSSGLGDLGGVSRPVGIVARKSWLRAWRSPIRLLFVAYPLFFVIAPISQAVETGTVPPTLPPSVALYLAWATGAAFTLNPIGDEGPVLPVTLTSPITGRTFVAGCCLAGAAIGLPITLVAAVGSAVLVGFGPVEVGGIAVLATLLPLTATGLASGVGALFPRLEPVNVTRGRKAIVPSLFGFAIFSIALSVGAAPGLAALTPVTRSLLTQATPLTSTVVILLGTGATAALLVGAGALSFTYAARTVDRYTLG